MAHGVTLQMRWIKCPARTYLHEHPAPRKVTLPSGLAVYPKPAGMTPYRNPDVKDRSLPGKATGPRVKGGPAMKAGDQVRVVRGMHGGREGIVTSTYVGIAGGQVIEVRLRVSQLVAVPDGPTSEVVLPYAPVELEPVAS